MVSLTTRANTLAGEIWGPIVADAKAGLRDFQAGEIEVIHRFLRMALENQRAHAERLGQQA